MWRITEAISITEFLLQRVVMQLLQGRLNLEMTSDKLLKKKVMTKCNDTESFVD